MGGDGIDSNLVMAIVLREFTFDKTHQTVHRRKITFILWELYLKPTFYKRERKFAFFGYPVWLDTKVTS